MGFLFNQSNAWGPSLYFPLRNNLALHNFISYSEFYGQNSRKSEKLKISNLASFYKKWVKIYSKWLKLG